MNLYVVRHGTTEWNAYKKMQGLADLSLNEQGREQALATKKNLEGISIDLILTSPLKRARETAEIIANGQKILVEEKLIERDYGEFEGVEQYNFDYDEFWSYGKNVQYERAENIRDFFARIYALLDDLKEKYTNQNILIVTHGGVIKAIECYAHGMMKDEDLGPFLPDNASVLKYEI